MYFSTFWYCRSHLKRTEQNFGLPVLCCMRTNGPKVVILLHYSDFIRSAQQPQHEEMFLKAAAAGAIPQKWTKTYWLSWLVDLICSRDNKQIISNIFDMASIMLVELGKQKCLFLYFPQTSSSLPLSLCRVGWLRTLTLSTGIYIVLKTCNWTLLFSPYLKSCTLTLILCEKREK